VFKRAPHWGQFCRDREEAQQMTKRQTKKDKSDWFDTHLIIMGPDSDFETKMREALKKEVRQEYQKRQDRKGAKK
jgi:hypothetical protein